MLEATNHIICPKCGFKNPVFTTDAILHACPSCQAVFNNPDKANNRRPDKDFAHYSQDLPIGIQFKHKGLLYTITGKLVKFEENDRKAVWTEYILTNPEAENIYLACWNGHWSLLESLPEFEAVWDASNKRNDIEFEGVYYPFFHKYRIRIAYAEGEFNFDVFEDDKKDAFEYINPPSSIIVEYHKAFKKVGAFKSTYLYKGELKRKLSDSIDIRSSVGIAGNQPFYWNFNPPFFLRGSIVFFLVLLILQLLIREFYPALLITGYNYEMKSNDVSKVYSFNSFDVPYDNALMNVTMGSGSLSNDWIATEMTLVNDATAEERSFSMETEHYSGYTDGESWSEGSYVTEGNINQVEKGSYHLEVTPIQQYGSATKDVFIKIEVFKGSWSVLWGISGLLILFNIVLGIAHDYFQHKKKGEDYDTFDFLFD